MRSQRGKRRRVRQSKRTNQRIYGHMKDLHSDEFNKEMDKQTDRQN